MSPDGTQSSSVKLYANVTPIYERGHTHTHTYICIAVFVRKFSDVMYSLAPNPNPHHLNYVNNPNHNLILILKQPYKAVRTGQNVLTTVV